MYVIEHPAKDYPKREFFNNATKEFITFEAKHVDAFRLKLEHSLLSISKWEAKHHKSFFGNGGQMPVNEFVDYIRCMTINEPSDPKVYDYLTENDLKGVMEYMEDPMSAVEIKPPKNKKKPGKKQIITSETFYMAMINQGIPFECEKWHFNRLSALLDVCSKNGAQDGYNTGKPKSQREIMEMYRALNDKNRAKYHSRG